MTKQEWTELKTFIARYFVNTKSLLDLDEDIFTTLNAMAYWSVDARRRSMEMEDCIKYFEGELKKWNTLEEATESLKDTTYSIPIWNRLVIDLLRRFIWLKDKDDERKEKMKANRKQEEKELQADVSNFIQEVNGR